MKNIILFDDDSWANFLPLAFTRPVSELRVGILSIREKWEKHLDAKASYITQEYLAEKYPIEIKEHNYIINGTVLPDEKLTLLISQLDHNEALLWDDTLIAAHLDKVQFDNLVQKDSLDEITGIEISRDDFVKLHHVSDIFLQNDEELRRDFKLLTKGRTSESLPDHVIVHGDNVFVEKGVQLEHCVLNSDTGPIYIGKNATIMDGAMVRGGLSLGEGSVLKMGAKIYGATTIGPYSKVGGEVNNCVIQGFSNKAHDGFLGNSVIGEWCNIGADSNNSNLKNNYTNVRTWNYDSERFEDTGLRFCGLIMGDHSKCAINTMFNTGTVVGVSANIFGEGFPRNFVPSFSWGGKQGFMTYKLDKALETAEIVMARRDRSLDEKEVTILQKVYDSTSKFRKWERS